MRIRTVAFSLLALAACGGRSSVPGQDAGPDAADVAPDTEADVALEPEADVAPEPEADVAPDTTASSDAAEAGGDGGLVRSFKATATVTLEIKAISFGADLDAWKTFPATHSFTVFVDAQGLRLVAGARGEGVAVALARTSTGFTTKEQFWLPIGGDRFCQRVRVAYQELSFSVEGGRLIGTGRGWASDDRIEGSTASMTATLEGVLDQEPPTITTSSATIDPMGDDTYFGASEPLAESAASLIGAQGDVFVLGAQVSEASPPFTTWFMRSPLMLNWGTTYQVMTEALFDLGGLMGVRNGGPTVATPPAPPLVAEDGFESVTTPTLGGAVMAAGAIFKPLTGAKSLLIADGDLDEQKLTPSVVLRLAVQPGDTVVRLSSRVFKAFEFEFEHPVATVRLGVPGRDVVDSSIWTRRKEQVPVRDSHGAYLYAEPVSTLEVGIPPGAAGDLSVRIQMNVPKCAKPALPIAVVIDDVRVE